MWEVNEPRSWRENVSSVVDDTTGMRYDAASVGGGIGTSATAGGYIRGGGGGESESLKYQAVEFMKGLGEMSVEFGRGCRDVVKQNLITEESFVVRKLSGPCAKIGVKLRFLNEFLPEDRDPSHVWTVIVSVFVIAFAAIYLTADHDTTIGPLIKKVQMHPRNATRILLPDGRRLAYQEQGVPADRARFSIIAPHSFLSSRLAGIPGLKASLLQEFGVRMVTYDLPGFGESDPHPNRNLESSAMDMLHLSYAVGVTDKFWVVGHSGGSIHAWAALRYIPDRLAGAAMLAPMVNPYDPCMTKHERSRTWGKWSLQRKVMYILARRFPRSLSYFYRRSFLSGKHGPIDEWLSLSPGRSDRALLEKPIFEEFWERNVEESVRRGDVKPFVEEAVLQVSTWGFRIADLKVQKKRKGKGLIFWLKSMYSKAEEELTGFLGPIHIWQGMEDRVNPPSMTDFVERVIPGVMLHKLLYDGHFTYFYFCDECHRQIFMTLFGNPQGPLAIEVDIDQTHIKEDDEEDKEEVTSGDDYAMN